MAYTISVQRAMEKVFILLLTRECALCVDNNRLNFKKDTTPWRVQPSYLA
jgi:hypothetical protein